MVIARQLAGDALLVHDTGIFLRKAGVRADNVVLRRRVRGVTAQRPAGRPLGDQHRSSTACQAQGHSEACGPHSRFACRVTKLGGLPPGRGEGVVGGEAWVRVSWRRGRGRSLGIQAWPSCITSPDGDSKREQAGAHRFGRRCYISRNCRADGGGEGRTRDTARAAERHNQQGDGGDGTNWTNTASDQPHTSW